jgi:hypothetical protein
MADIINLNKARKARARQTDKARAAQNRVVFGTSTKLKQLEKARQKQADARLEGAKLEGAGLEAKGPDAASIKPLK